MILDSPIISGSSTVTGNLTVLGTLTANVSGSTTSASYATNAETLDGLDSTSFTTTSSFNTASGSFSTRVTNLETASGSFSTRVTNNESTGSSLVSASGSFSTRTTNLESASGSFSTRVTNTEATASSLTTASGSFSTRTTNLETASGSFSTRTTNLETASGSFSTRVTSAEGSVSSLNNKSGSYATTGSNNFNGNQVITGSLTTTGTIVAQTLNVQQVTSSIVYSSGSNIFGNSVSNTQQFTGSFLQSGSLAYFAGNVGIGVVSPNTKLEVNGNIYTTSNTNFLLFGTNPAINPYIQGASDNSLYIGNNNTSRIFISGSGNVGIGTTSPTNTLDVLGGFIVRGSNGSGVATIGTSSGRGQYQYITFGGGTGGTDYGWQVGRSPQTGGIINDGFYIYDIRTNNTPFAIALGGNVGIGTTSPGYKLEVQGTFNTSGNTTLAGTGQNVIIKNHSNYPWFEGQSASAQIFFGRSGTNPWAIGADASYAFRLWDSNFTTGYFEILTNGNVGIGTTSPFSKLHVEGSSTVLSVVDNAPYAAGVGGALYLYGNYRSVGDVTVAGYIKGSKTNSTNGDYGFDLTFGNQTYTGGVSEKMRILSTGNVGIGTTSPGTKLEILSRAADADRTIPHNVLTITAEQGNAPYGFFGGAILFKNRSYVSGMVESSRIRSVIYDDGAPNNFGGGLWFETTPTPGGTLTPSLVLNYQGRVGIGTTSPGDKLDVNGNILLSETGYISGRAYPYTTTVGSGADATKTYIDAGSTAGYRSRIMLSGGGAADANTIILYTASSERMRVTSGGNVGIGNTSPLTKLVVNNAVAGAILPYIQGTGLSYNNEGISVAGSNTSNTNIGNGLTLYNNVASVGAYGPVVAWSSMTAGGAYNATYAFITGIYGGTGGDSNWAIGDLIFGTGDAYGATERMRIRNNGNVGIGTTSPIAKLHITSVSVNPATAAIQADSKLVIAGTDGNMDLMSQDDNSTVSNAIGFGRYNSGNGALIHKFGIVSWANTGAQGSNTGDRIGFHYGTNASAWDSTELMTIKSGGNVGVGLTNPLATLATLGGAVQIMGDYRNHATIIRSAGANGTLNGSLVITIPEMSNANVDGYGGYSCEVYVAGYDGMYCHAWFSGYINGGIVASEATILRSNGGWSISQTSYGTYNQGFQFTIDYPSSIIHPTARIIFNKGGSPNATAYPANSITTVFS